VPVTNRVAAATFHERQVDEDLPVQIVTQSLRAADDREDQLLTRAALWVP